MRIDRIELLAPKMADMVRDLAEDLTRSYETGLTKTHFKVFETLRLADRQLDLIKQGVSKAGMWQSAHQFGLAVDFVPYLSLQDAVELSQRTKHSAFAGWNWHAANDYSFLSARAQKIGLATPIKWDPCHVQHPDFERLRRLWRNYFE